MLYRNSKEYEHPITELELEPLRSWLRGDVGIEALKEWLRGRYEEGG